MELGGVSVPGKSARSGGAHLVKDLSAFETKLGGLQAFVMVSDGTADDESAGAAARLAARAADTYLETILFGIAFGETPAVEPAFILKTVVAEANAAILSAAAEEGASRMGATFCGALISADKVWFGSVGEGRGYLLRSDKALELVVNTPAPAEVSPQDTPTDGEAQDPAPVAVTATALGQEGVAIEVGSAPLNPGDAIVLCGRTASGTLSGADIFRLTCAACDAQASATSLADSAANSEPDDSVTVAIWSADSALFAPPAPPVVPTPVPTQQVLAPPPIIAANHDASSGLRREQIFLWVMSGWIVFAFMALGAGMFISRPATPTDAADLLASQDASATTQEVTATPAATETVQPEYPKTLTVPKNVRGGVWLRRAPNTLGGTNEVVVLKPGAVVQAVDTTVGTDDKARMQDFYVLMVSDISAKQVLKTASHPWPPPKSVKKVYVFAGSFE